jgi:predicted phosphodiesterase
MKLPKISLNQYAVLADIHGNIWALEAVLADVRRRKIRHHLNLGDAVYGPLEPQATALRLARLRSLVSIRGNQDRLPAEGSPHPASPTLDYVLQALTPQSRAWLASHPATAMVGQDLFLCHGTPASDETYLLEAMSPQGGFLHDLAVIQAQLAGVSRAVVLCGHSHLPRTVQLSDGRLVINPGSVGLPAYSDDTPVAHKMETGSPHARYAVLAETVSGWRVEQVTLPYAWKKAVDKARENGRNDWAAWLESGRA